MFSELGSTLRRLPVSGWVLTILVAICLGAPWLAPYDPNEQPDSVAGRLRPPGTTLHAVALAQGGWKLADEVERTTNGVRILRNGAVEELATGEVSNLTADGVADRRVYWLGSDAFSRDVLSRWLHGGRLSITVGLFAILLAIVVGVGVGALAGLAGGWVDSLLMRLVEAIQTVPFLVLLIALRALLPPGPGTLVLILGATSWTDMARLTRSEVLTLKNRDFINASRGLGLTEGQIFRRHLLPNALTPLIVYATLGAGYLIASEAALSFLGLGIEMPQASWGNMIEQGRHHASRAWWLVTVPAGSLVVTVVSLHLLADRLRDALDPRHAPSGF